MPNILLADLDVDIQQKLSRELGRLGYSVSHSNPIDLVFASADHAPVSRPLKLLRCGNPALPVILIDRIASDERWLAALEAGATDYCGADIDPGGLQWIVENALGAKRETARTAAA